MEVGAIAEGPPSPLATLVLGHGAGAGMRHPFMEALAAELAARNLASLRYQFPYMEARSRRPDPRAVLLDTVRAAVESGARLAEGGPVFAAGKSMGGRMSSQAASEGLIDVRGVVFFGFPLHPANQPSTSRADHLSQVRAPMLFLQGTRDTLCDLSLLEPIVERLGSRAELRILEGADHGFHVLKRSGRTDAQVLADLARLAHAWIAGVLGAGPEGTHAAP